MSVFRFTKLREHTEKIGSGVTPQGGEASYKSKGIPLIRSQNVRVNRLDLSDVALIDQDQHNKMSGSKVVPGDVLLNITGASIGRSCVVPHNVVESNVNQHVCIIRPKASIDARFLSLFLNSWFGQKQICSFQGGGSREALNFQQIGKFDIPTPPIPEQKAISDLLSTWDEAIEKTERLVKAKEKRFKWLLRELISEPRNTQYNRECKEVKIGSFLIESRIPDRENNPKKRLSVRLHLKGVEVREYKGTKSDGATLYFVRKAGQFIYGKQNVFRGSFGIVPIELDGYSSTQDIPAFDVADNVDKTWLLFQFSYSNFYKKLELYSSGSGSKRLHPKELFRMKISLPPLKIQKQISDILSSTQQEIAMLKQLLDKYKTQKRGLMQKMLTGEWRVNTEIAEK